MYFEMRAADGVETLVGRKGLRDQHLAAHGLVELVNARHRLARLLVRLPEPFRNLFKRVPVPFPNQFGDLKVVGIFEVVDRIVVCHGKLSAQGECERKGVEERSTFQGNGFDSLMVL